MRLTLLETRKKRRRLKSLQVLHSRLALCVAHVLPGMWREAVARVLARAVLRHALILEAYQASNVADTATKRS